MSATKANTFCNREGAGRAGRQGRGKKRRECKGVARQPATAKVACYNARRLINYERNKILAKSEQKINTTIAQLTSVAASQPANQPDVASFVHVNARMNSANSYAKINI